MKERLLLRVAWLMPKSLVYWSAIRLVAHATTGEYESTEVSTLNVMDALKRWEASTR